MIETRSALSAIALREQLAYPLMGICALIDRITVYTTTDLGDEAFILDEEEDSVSFRSETIIRILQEADKIADEVGYSDENEIKRLREKAVNQFIIHELIHIKQNFPHFGSVQQIKQGMPGLGMPILDTAADVVSAWTCANVECERLNLRSRVDILKEFVNALILAYMMGAFVFQIRNKSPKIQRVLGLIISALLVQALCQGTLQRETIYEGWRELSPILILDMEKVSIFNCFVMDGMPGLLLKIYEELPDNLGKRFWNSAGQKPLFTTLKLGADILTELGVIAKVEV